jgi:hypothetical protein
MCIEQQFERSPENEMLGTVEKNGGKGAFEILRRVGAGDCCRRVEVGTKCQVTMYEVLN